MIRSFITKIFRATPKIRCKPVITRHLCEKYNSAADKISATITGYTKPDIEANEILITSYRDFDILIPDLTDREITNIGECEGIPNLSPATFPSTPFPVRGRVWGLNMRPMVPLVCKSKYYGGKSNPVIIWFLCDPAFPYTTISVKSLKKLVGEDCTHELCRVIIQDSSIPIQCHVSKTNFEHVNILGVDAFERLNVSIKFDWKKSRHFFHLVRT